MYTSPSTHTRHGIVMLEVLLAVALLTFAVVSVSSAIVAGQQQSAEARTKIIGAIAAESLISQLSQEPWATLNSWDGYTEPVGTIVDPTGQSIGGDWSEIGRQVSIVDSDIFIEPLQVYIVGKNVTVSSFTNSGRILSTVKRFVPEPQP